MKMFDRKVNGRMIYGVCLIVCILLSCFVFRGTVYADELDEEGIKINALNFPQLYKTLKGYAYDTDQDGFLSAEEIANLKVLAVPGEISDLTGIGKLTALEKLYLCRFSGATLRLDRSVRQIQTLCVTPTKGTFTIKAPYIKNLAVGQVTCEDDSIGQRVLLRASYNQSAHMNNAMRKLVLTDCTQVEDLFISMGRMNTLVLPKAGNSLNRLNISGAEVKTLDLKNAKKLKVLEMDTSERIKTLDLTKNTNLVSLTLGDVNALTDVKLNRCAKLTYAYISWNVGMKKVDFSKCKRIKKVFRPNTAVSVVMPSGKASALTGYGWDAKNKKDYEAYEKYRSDDKFWMSGSVSQQNANDSSYYQKHVVKLDRKHFPDIYSTIKYLDYDQDGWLSQGELDTMMYLSCDTKVKSLQGIKYFTFLSEIRLTDYTGEKITIPDSNKCLRELNVTCSAKKLTVNADQLKSLKITMTNKSATKVDASACKNLSAFILNGTETNAQNVSLRTVAMPKCGSKLKYLELEALGIDHVNFSDYPNLEGIGIFYNPKLKSVSLSKNTKLRGIWIANDKMNTIDLSKCTKLEEYFSLYNKCILPKNGLPKRNTNSWIYALFYSIDGYQM